MHSQQVFRPCLRSHSSPVPLLNRLPCKLSRVAPRRKHRAVHQTAAAAQRDQSTITPSNPDMSTAAPQTQAPQNGSLNDNVPKAQPGLVWYFAYGSNMNKKVLTGRRNVHPLHSLPASLDGYVLGFHMYGVPYIEPGMATVTPVNPTAKRVAVAARNGTASKPMKTAQEAYEARLAAGCHGVIHLVTDAEWEQVKLTEGVRIKGLGYQVITVQCKLYDGRTVEAYTLEAAPISTGDIRQFLPSQRYIGLLREGAREMGVDPAYCDMLDNQPAYEPLQGISSRAAQLAMGGFAMALIMPVVPVMVGTMAYRRARKLLGGNPDELSHNPTAPGAVATALKTNNGNDAKNSNDDDKTNGGGMNGTENGHPTTNGTAQTNGDASGTPSKAVSSGENGAATQANGHSQEAAAKPETPKAPPPAGPVGKVFFFMRQHLPPKVMSVSMFGVFRGLWFAHDWMVSPLLGSGNNNRA